MIRRVILAFVILGVGITICEYLKWHILVPADIQRRALGRELVGYSELEDFEFSITGYGDAVFAWDYEVDRETYRAIREMCSLDERGDCVVNGKGLSNEDESDIVFLRKGRLRMEKWWY
jgi:hypothetical protein